MDKVEDNAQHKWERDMQVEIDRSKWQDSCRYIQSIFINALIKERFYKVGHRWYLTPDRLFLQIQDVGDVGSLIYNRWTSGNLYIAKLV